MARAVPPLFGPCLTDGPSPSLVGWTAVGWTAGPAGKKGVQEILDASCHQGVSNALVSRGADEGVFTHVDLSQLVVVDGQSLLTQLADRLGMVGMVGREVPNHPDLDG